jgi:hypothetical protein
MYIRHKINNAFKSGNIHFNIQILKRSSENVVKFKYLGRAITN